MLYSLTVRPLHNAPFCPITASGSNFNPRNTQCIPVVEIITFLVLGQKWTFFKGLTGRGKAGLFMLAGFFTKP